MKLMKHQLTSIKHSKKQPLIFDTSDAGTGKTAVRIVVFAERRRLGGGCLLVLAPRSLLVSAWYEDFKKFAPDMKVAVATAANREEAFAQDADAYITNHDAVKWLVKQKKVFWSKFSEIVIDESTAFKHHTSQRSKAISRIVHQIAPQQFKYRSAMTATPTSNGMTDIWHQVHLLDGGRRLGPSFYGFRNSVCYPVQVGPNVHAVKWEDREGAEEAIYGLLSDIVIRHERDKCVDLPPNHVYEITYQLSPAQKKAYVTLEATQVLLLQPERARSKLTGKAPKITAINAAAMATKLLQIASGAVYTGEGGYKLVDTGRYELVMDLVEQVKHSLVLFLWEHQRDFLKTEAEKRGLRYCVLDGKTSDKDRADLVKKYQAGWFDVMIAHPRTAGHGLTLTKGTRTIWASPTYDLELWEQASMRQHRIGQTKKTETIVVIAQGTIDERVYNEILMPKGVRMKNLLGLFAA